MEYANIYYFSKIAEIGGIEEFFYQLSCKYKETDLTIFYREADQKQLERISKNIRCVKYVGQYIKCKKAFFNFNLDIIDNVEAEEYVLVVHGNYNWLKGKPPMHPKITKCVAVSKDSAEAYTALTGIPCGMCYNPFLTVKPKKIIKLVSACRLADAVKGAERTLKLINAVDLYAQKHNLSYIWYIFSNVVPDGFKSYNNNVIIMQPTLNILSYMADADYVVQLSDNMEGYCYTVNQALSIGTPVVITPCSVFAELGITEDMAITLEFNLSNLQEVAESIFNKAGTFNFSYTPPADGWDKLFVNAPSTYAKEREEMEKEYKVKALDTYQKLGVKDAILGRKPKAGEEFTVKKIRLDMLLGNNIYNAKFVEIAEADKEAEVTTAKKKVSKKIKGDKKNEEGF